MGLLGCEEKVPFIGLEKGIHSGAQWLWTMWRFGEEKGSLCCKLIASKYGLAEGGWDSRILRRSYGKE